MTRFEQILLEEPRHADEEQHQCNNPWLVNGVDLTDAGAQHERAHMEPRPWQELADSANQIALPEGQEEASADSTEGIGWVWQELADQANNIMLDVHWEDGGVQGTSWRELADRANGVRLQEHFDEQVDRFLELFDEDDDQELTGGNASDEAL